MKHVQLNLAQRLLTVLVLVLLQAGVMAADGNENKTLDTPKKLYEEYARETSVPAVPAATLLGVDKSKIVEVASVSKLSGTLTAARDADAQGTPLGIDLSPALLIADKGGKIASMVKKDQYASDQLARLLFRTRLSLATATRDNSHMNAWGVYTRPLDFRDPFVDPALERCFVSFTTDYDELRRSPTSMPPLGERTQADLRRFNLVLDLYYAKDSPELKTARDEVIAAMGPASPEQKAAVQKVSDRHAALSARAKLNADQAAVAAKALQTTYGTCVAKATDQLANRSYIALGYTKGTARAVDATKAFGLKPGQAFWITFVYGFEGIGAVFGGEAAWRATGAVRREPTLLEQNGRLTLHLARHRGSSKLVDSAEQSTAGHVAGIGFDYADGNTRRFSVQAVHAREGEGPSRLAENTAVIGADFKVGEGAWLGLSWGRKSTSSAGSDKEVKAQLKWAFSDKSWLAD